jgi:dipeptidyl-peptidase-4
MLIRVFSALVGLSVATIASAQQTLPSDPFSIERLQSFPIVSGRSPAGAQMSPDGSKIVFGWNQTGGRKLDVWMMDFPSGRKRRLLSADSISDLPRQDDARTDLEKKETTLYDGGISSFAWAPDSKEISFAYKGRIWLMQADGSKFRPLFDGNVGAFSASYSHDGKYIGYNQGVNVFRYDRQSGAIKQLTFISKPQTVIGGFDWSPDSKHLAVFWSDSSKTGHGVMMDYSKDRGEVVNIQREWNGDLSENVQVGMVPVEGGLIKFVDGLPHSAWLKEYDWNHDSTKLAIGWISEDFMNYTVSMIDADTAKRSDVYTEKSPLNYINDWRPMTFTKDGKHLDLGTDILNGKLTYRSIVQMDPDGKNIHPIFAEKYDVGAMLRPKDSDRLILVTAARSPLTTEITILEPNGQRTVHNVMPDGYATGKNFDDAAPPLVSDDGMKIATLASDRKINPELYSVEPTEKRLTESQTNEFNKIKWADVKEVTFPGPDGQTLHGLLFTRPGLDMSVKHPAVLSNVYGDSGKAAWGGFIENYLAMNLNMVVLCVDFEASWGYGGEFDNGYYKKMGLIDADQAVAAKNYLASLSYVKPDRCAIWGWSYGGYLTCMTLLTKPGTFYAGVAVAPVTDWGTYNEWYTRRRLGLLKDDKAIFAKTSPITYASGLKDNLLLIHGVMDDNVLFQNTALLSEKLIEAGKYFDVFIFPRDDHGIGKEASRPEVFGKIVRYLNEKLNTP